MRAPGMSGLTAAERREFAWRALMLVLWLVVAALVWYTAKVLLLAFAGVMLAVLLDFLADRIRAVTGLGRGWSFAAVVVGLFVLIALLAWEAVPRVADQVSELIHYMPAAAERLRAHLQGSEWGRTLLQYLPSLLSSTDITGKMSLLLRKALEAGAGVVVFAVIGLYVGASPHFYEQGFLKLFPEAHRGRAAYVLRETAYTIRWWMLGQLVPMIVLGVATTVGLWLLHVHLAFTLGLFTGLMIFIPYIGAIISLVVAVIVAAIQGPSQILYVTMLFIGVHIAEGYLLTPLVQKRAVYLPPGLSILSQVLLELLIGFLGLALAAPLTAVGLVLVRMLYLHEAPLHHG